MKILALLCLSVGALFAQPTISTTSLPGWTVGGTYSATLAATGGTPPYSNWTVTVGTLPTGLSLNAATGAITGTPTVTGTSTMTFTVQDSLGAPSVGKVLSITINGLPSISTASIPDGTFGSAYYKAMAGTGGTLPYAWYIPSGTGCGMVISGSGGQLTGMVTTTASTCTVTINLVDKSGFQDTKSYTIAIAPIGVQVPVGKGCTTALVLDNDCDGYGVGPGMLPDADDSDPAVNTSATVISTYGSISAFLTHRGFSNTHIVYVATTGNDATCAVNDITKPCATINKAMTLAVAGDAILVRGGTYGQNVSVIKSGNSSNWYTLMAYPGELPILDTAADCSIRISERLIQHLSQNYWRFVGFVIQDSHHTGIAPCLGFPDGIYGGQAGPISIIDNLIMNMRWAIDENYQNPGLLVEHNVFLNQYGEHDIYIGNDSRYAPVTGIVIRGNVLGYSIFTDFHSNGQIDGMLIEDNIMSSAETGMELQNGVTNSVIQNNVIFNSLQQAIVMSCYDGNAMIFGHDQNHNKIVNNTIWLGNKSYVTGSTISGEDAFRFVDSTPVTPIAPQGLFPPDGIANPYPCDLGNNTVANNIIYSTTGASMLYLNQHTPWVASTNFVNNLWQSFQSTRMVNWGVGQFGIPVVPPACQSTYNDQEVGGSCPTPGQVFYDLTAFQALYPSTINGNVYSDPLFVSANSTNWDKVTAFDFTLNSGSPAATLSSATYAPTLDIRGNVRGATSAAGAYASNSPILTVAPTTTAYTYTLGGATPAAQTITVGSLGVTLDNWSATTGQSWITLTPASGIAAGTFALGIDVTGLTAGTYSGSVSVASTTTGITNSPIAIGVSLTVSASPTVTVTTTTVPAGVWTVAYTTTLAASGGTPPYTWAVSTGTLPAGLSLASSTGIISGTASTPTGTSGFAVIATDSASHASPAQSLSITIPDPRSPLVGGSGIRGR